LELDLAHALPELVLGLDDVEQQDASARVHDAAGGVEECALHLRRLVHDHHQLAAVARLKDASFLGHAPCCHGIPPPTIEIGAPPLRHRPSGDSIQTCANRDRTWPACRAMLSTTSPARSTCPISAALWP